LRDGFERKVNFAGLARDNFIDRPYGSSDFPRYSGTQARHWRKRRFDHPNCLLAGLFAAASGVMILALASGVVPVEGRACSCLGWSLRRAPVPARGRRAPAALVCGCSATMARCPKAAPFWSRAVYHLAGLVCIGTLAAIGTWVGFGPGERAFSTTIPFPWEGRETN